MSGLQRKFLLRNSHSISTNSDNNNKYLEILEYIYDLNKNSKDHEIFNWFSSNLDNKSKNGRARYMYVT